MLEAFRQLIRGLGDTGFQLWLERLIFDIVNRE